jgi:DNA-binding protein H-NS
MAKNSLSDLLAQKAALDKQIADLQRNQRAEAIARVRALMNEYGLTPADIASGATRAPRAAAGDGAAGGAATAAKGKRGGRSANAGRKVAPKYRDPATGSTWSGRGLKPKWLAAALAQGRQLSEFAL